MREANDRGYECLLLEDCTGATDYDNYLAALQMVKMQGGVFGAVAPSSALLSVLERRLRPDGQPRPPVGGRPPGPWPAGDRRPRPTADRPTTTSRRARPVRATSRRRRRRRPGRDTDRSGAGRAPPTCGRAWSPASSWWTDSLLAVEKHDAELLAVVHLMAEAALAEAARVRRRGRRPGGGGARCTASR